MGIIRRSVARGILRCFQKSSKFGLGSWLIPQLAFPNNEGTPAQPSQLFSVFLISSPVPQEFFKPVLAVAFRNTCTASATVSVPKAPVHKDSLV